MPDISVIIPCYNAEKWIDRCLESIVRQTIGIDRLEIICVDDCSTDNTFIRLQEWEKRFPDNFLLIESPINGRQGQARNIGLQYASGYFIGFIDADDWVELDYFERMLEVYTDGVDIVYCGNMRDFSKELSFAKRSSEEMNVLNPTMYDVNSDERRKEFIVNAPLGHGAWAKIIRKDFLLENELYFFPNLTYEDAAWSALTHLYVRKAVKIQNKLYHYFVNDNSTILVKNSTHYLDIITAQTMLWKQYEARGMLDKYRDELQMDHIYSAYLSGMKTLILRYDEPDYNIYLLLRELMLDRIGDYKNNKYIKDGQISEIHLLVLAALDAPLSKKQFMEFAENAKRIGI